MDEKVYHAVSSVSRCSLHISLITGMPWKEVAESLDRLYQQNRIYKNTNSNGAIAYRKPIIKKKRVNMNQKKQQEIRVNMMRAMRGGGKVSVDKIASLVGIDARLARVQLHKLVQAGFVHHNLLEDNYQRTTPNKSK